MCATTQQNGKGPVSQSGPSPWKDSRLRLKKVPASLDSLNPGLPDSQVLMMTC